MKPPRPRSRSTTTVPPDRLAPDRLAPDRLAPDRLAPDQQALDQRIIDERYGLEPVFEPQGSTSCSADGGTQFTTVQCPYCGESFDTPIDLSAGSTSYIEDCQVCCRPIELGIEIGVDGELGSVNARRTD